MDPLTITAAAGLRSRLEALDLLANNISNASTSGFKADREAYSLYLGEDSQNAAATGEGEAQVTAPHIETHRTDFSQGQLKVTGSTTDLALDGSGFFVVDGPNGTLLTRTGTVKVTADGKFTTVDGYEFATVEPRRIRLDPLKSFTVSADGTVSQDGQPMGRLKLAGVDTTTQPPKREGVYFAIDTKADSTNQTKLTASTAVVRQGQVESSNYSPSEASVRLVGVLRQFESLQKAIQIGTDMSRKAVEEVARV
jgi:flagellar basal body rod protein FlgG